MVWGPGSTDGTPDLWRKNVDNFSKNLEKRLENDLQGHLQSSEFAYTEVQGWQTFPQWSRGPVIWIFHNFLDPKIYKKFGAPPLQGTFILIPIDPFKSDQVLALYDLRSQETFPQWSRGPIIWIFHSFLDLKIYKKFGAPPVEGTFILIPIES